MSHGGNPKIVYFMEFSKYDGTSPYLTLQATYNSKNVTPQATELVTMALA